MKSYVSLSLALLAGTAFGAIAIEELQAQAKPPVYLIVENHVMNRAAYVKEFIPVINRGIKEHGGRTIARGKTTSFLGAPPDNAVVIQRWDSMDQLVRWQNSQQFKDAIKIGQKYAKFRTFAVPGIAK